MAEPARTSQPSMADPIFFTSRPWLEAKVAHWLAASDVSRVMVVLGGPGTGKSRFLHALSLRLAEPDGPDGPQLGGAILRDLRANRSGEFSWSSLKHELLRLVGGPRPVTVGPTTVVTQNIETMAPGAQVVGQMFSALLLNSDPVGDLRENVLVHLAALPPGPPLVIVVDGLDEAFRENAREFIAVVSALAAAIDRPQDGDRGIGRLRLIVASQPEVPIDVNPPRRRTIVDLAKPDQSDEDALMRYASALLADLPAKDRDRLARSVAKGAHGIWVWAFYVAQAIADDFAGGKLPPQAATAPRALADVYTEALLRARGRLGDRWSTGAHLLALVSAAQDVGATLPKDVALAALGIDGARLADLLVGLKALVTTNADRRFQFFHGDFGRWIADGGYELANTRDAHDRLAAMLTELGGQGWAMAGAYAASYVMPHALAAAELDLGTVRFAASNDRCLRLAKDLDLLSAGLAQPHDSRGVRYWHSYIDRLSHLCPADTMIAGSVPLTGLAKRLRLDLEANVGRRLVAKMTKSELAEFEEFQNLQDEQGALAALEVAQPDYRSVVASELHRQWARVMSGWQPLADPGSGLHTLALELRKHWQETRDAEALDRSVSAFERAVELTPADHEGLTSRMIGLVLAYDDRIGTDGERPGDLDQLIAVRSQLITRQDLESPETTHAMYGYWLYARWRRDPVNHSDDLDLAVDAFEQAAQLTPAEHSDRINNLAGLANAYMDRVNSDSERPGDFARLLAVQAELTRLPGHYDPGQAHALYGHLLHTRWRRDPDEHRDDLDLAVDAFEQAVELTPADHDDLTNRMIGLANAYGSRARADNARPDALDRLLTVQAELTTRPDHNDPGQAHAVYGHWLHTRWRRDPVEHSNDLDLAVDAFEHAVELTPTDHDDLTNRMIGLANAYASRARADNAHPDALDRLLTVQAKLTTRPDLDNPGQAHAVYGHWLHTRWRQSQGAHDLDLHDTIDAIERALALGQPDDPALTGRLAGLADALIDRVDGRRTTFAGPDLEQPGDLDRLIEVQGQIVQRPNLSDPARVYGIHEQWLLRRWRQDPDRHAADLPAAFAAAAKALERIPEDSPYLGYRQARLANLHLLGYINRLPGAALSRAFELAAAASESDNKADDELLPALKRAARQADATTRGEQTDD